MSRLSLKSLRSKHFYKAKAIKSTPADVNSEEPVFAADSPKMNPEIAEIVNYAVVAEELSSSESILTNLQASPITSAGVKSPRIPLYYRIQSNILRPAEVKRLRRDVIKSIHQPTHKTPKVTKKSHKSSTKSKIAKSKTIAESAAPVKTPVKVAQSDTKNTKNDGFRELHDGDMIRIRPARSVASIANPVTTEPTKRERHRRSLKLMRHLRRFTKRTRTKVNAIACQMRHRPTRAELINAESRLGSTIFGPIPAGHRREFFHDQHNVWIWHEDWRDAHHHEHVMTVRYEVRPSGVYKKLSAGRYVKLVGQELENFRQATHVYLYLIKQQLYRHAA